MSQNFTALTRTSRLVCIKCERAYQTALTACYTHSVEVWQRAVELTIPETARFNFLRALRAKVDKKQHFVTQECAD